MNEQQAALLQKIATDVGETKVKVEAIEESHQRQLDQERQDRKEADRALHARVTEAKDDLDADVIRIDKKATDAGKAAAHAGGPTKKQVGATVGAGAVGGAGLLELVRFLKELFLPGSTPPPGG